VTVEAVDAQGRRCPTDEAPVSFTVKGPVIWRGGYNSGILNSTNATTLLTECGVNRVAVRATLTAGTATLTASRPGLASASVTLPVKPCSDEAGLARSWPSQSSGPIAGAP
jgi:beta-galactosidase